MRSILFLLVFSFPAALFAADMLSVSARQANVHSGPAAGSKVVWMAAKYYPLKVLSKKGEWVRISDYENAKGWIARSLLSSVPTVVVTAEKANLREGPGTGHAVLWELDKEYSLKVLKTEGDWYKVTDGGQVSGWINKSAVWGFTGEAAGDGGNQQ